MESPLKLEYPILAQTLDLKNLRVAKGLMAIWPTLGAIAKAAEKSSNAMETSSLEPSIYN